MPTLNELVESLSHKLINFGESKMYPNGIKVDGLELRKRFPDWDATDWYLSNCLSNEMLPNMTEYGLSDVDHLRNCVAEIMANFERLTRPKPKTYTEAEFIAELGEIVHEMEIDQFVKMELQNNEIKLRFDRKAFWAYLKEEITL